MDLDFFVYHFHSFLQKVLGKNETISIDELNTHLINFAMLLRIPYTIRTNYSKILEKMMKENLISYPYFINKRLYVKVKHV
jgi:hypothetical protein